MMLGINAAQCLVEHAEGLFELGAIVRRGKYRSVLKGTSSQCFRALVELAVTCRDLS